MKIYFNGKLVPKEEAAVSVFDHGLLYGDGVFEGIRFYGGRAFRLEEHIDRLYKSARAIALDIQMNPDEMARAVVQTIAANGLTDAAHQVAQLPQQHHGQDRGHGCRHR